MNATAAKLPPLSPGARVIVNRRTGTVVAQLRGRVLVHYDTGHDKLSLVQATSMGWNKRKRVQPL